MNTYFDAAAMLQRPINDNRETLFVWRTRQAQVQARALAHRLERARFNAAWLSIGRVEQ